jgi:hypothetical protein
MKLKQLFLAVTITLFAISCTKQDAFTPQPNAVKSEAVASTMSIGSTSESSNLAYVFIEPQSKTSLVTKYMKDTARVSKFYSFWVGLNLTQTNASDLNKYIDIPHWYNGLLPSVRQVEIPQNSVGTDINGKPVIAYNFKSFMIPKNTINDWVWVTIFVPTSSMLNDTKRQKKVEYTYKSNNVTKLTQNYTLTGSAPYSIIVNYTGNRIPQGTYRVISTWTNTNMRVKLNKTDDVYFRGNGN